MQVFTQNLNLNLRGREASSSGASSTAGGNPVWWALAAASVPVAVATVAWSTRISEYYVPYEYQYRPGTISGWLAKMLHKHSKQRRRTRPIRVYMDGCFDMMHYGHANALRQAKAVGDELVVGLIPDDEIMRCKGCRPVLNEAERLTLVENIKWVDEVITGAPYDLYPEFIEELFTKHRVDYIIHGDDPCLLPDGTDAYAHAKKLGRFKMIKRTEGVSTTDIVGRMLTCTRVNKFVAGEHRHEMIVRQFSRGHETDSDSDNSETGKKSRRTVLSHFMPTSRRIVQFANGAKKANPNSRIVYIDGAFDVFHVGHVAILQEAKAMGDFLLVGLHGDEEVVKRRGPHMPIMNLHERSLSVLACKHVDEVIIGVPPGITGDLIRTFNISLVVRGSLSETSHLGAAEPGRYDTVQKMGIYREIKSPSAMTTRSLIRRIVDNCDAFEARNEKKQQSEQKYYQEHKEFVEEL